jgi:hypothetical protein
MLGAADGRLYMMMEYCGGGSLVTTVFYLHRGNAKSPAVATAMVVPTRAGLFAGIGWRF